MNEPRVTISPEGQRRQRQILELALVAADRRRRKRLVGRAGALVVIASLLAIPVVLSHRSASRVIVKTSPSPAPPGPASSSGVALIPTDPTITERLAIRPNPGTIVIIHDDELLAGLAQAHEPAGLAYVNGKPMLLFRR
jgi:hypothetical protein